MASEWSKEPTRLAESLRRHFAETEKAEAELAVNVTDTTAHTSNVRSGDDLVLKCAERAKTISGDMLRAIKNLEKQCGGATDSPEFRGKKEQLLMAQFSEIVGADPFFGDLLRHFKEIYDNTRKERDQLLAEKSEREQRHKEEQEKQLAVIETQKSAISGLRLQVTGSTKEAGRLKQRTEDYRSKLAATEQRLHDKVEDLLAVKRENERLIDLLKKMSDYGDPAQGNSEEDVCSFGNYQNKKLHESTLEVGRRHVRIPVLDFTKLPPGKPSTITVVKYGSGSPSSSSNKEGTLVIDQDGGSAEVAADPQEQEQEALQNLLESAGQKPHHFTP